MYRIDFEYYSLEAGSYETDSFEVINEYKEFLYWLEDNDIASYKILNITAYND